jgi:ankyrin repeat protein
MNKKVKYIILIMCLFLLSGCAYQTRLMKASGERNDMPTVKKLLDKGVDINEMGPLGTALSIAAYYGNLEIVKYLLDKGAYI